MRWCRVKRQKNVNPGVRVSTTISFTSQFRPIASLALARLLALLHSSRLPIATRVMSQGVEYSAIVVGAGPGGLAAVASLLDAQIASILWVDRTFQGGRLNEIYREISS